MSVITAIEVEFFTAFLWALLTVLTALILWPVRNKSLYLWCSSGLFHAVYSIAVAASSMRSELFWLAPTSGLATVALTAAAFGALLSRDVSLRHTAIGIALISAAGGTLWLLGIDRWLLSAGFLFACVPVSLISTILAGQLGWKQGFISAKLMAVMLGLQTILLTLAATVGLISGEDVLQISTRQTSLISLAPSTVFTITLSALYIGLILAIAARRNEREQRELLAANAKIARLDERQRLLNDMHDGFGSQLSSARLSAQHGLLSQSEMVRILEECVSDLYLTVDTVNYTEGDIGHAIRYLRHRLATRLFGHPITLQWKLETEGVPTLPPETILQLLRMLQEGINNALRHSGARHIDVLAEYNASRGQLKLEVTDDGVGMPKETTERAGLRNLRGRVARLKGQLEIRSAETGTTLSITLPLAAG